MLFVFVKIKRKDRKFGRKNVIHGELCCVCLSRLKKGQKIWEERRNIIHIAALHMKDK